MSNFWWTVIFFGCAISMLRIVGSTAMKQLVYRVGMYVIRISFTVPILFFQKGTEVCVFLAGFTAYLWNAICGMPQKRVSAEQLNELHAKLRAEEANQDK